MTPSAPLLSNSPISGTVPTALSGLPTGWSEAIDLSTGRTYYRDDINQTTSWTRPTSPAVPNKSNNNNNNNNNNSWNGNNSVNLMSFGTVNSNVNSNISSNNVQQASSTPQPYLTAAPLDFSANALPIGWEECIDPKTGRKFYRNHFTKSTQWTRPVATPDPKISQSSVMYGTSTVAIPTFTNQTSNSQGYYQAMQQPTTNGYSNNYSGSYNPYTG
jgi:hypothetical protein